MEMLGLELASFVVDISSVEVDVEMERESERTIEQKKIDIAKRKEIQKFRGLIVTKKKGLRFILPAIEFFVLLPGKGQKRS